MEASSKNIRKRYTLGSKKTLNLLARHLLSSIKYWVMSFGVNWELLWSKLLLSCWNITSFFFYQQYLLTILTRFHLGQLNVRVFSAVRMLSCWDSTSVLWKEPRSWTELACCDPRWGLTSVEQGGSLLCLTLQCLACTAFDEAQDTVGFHTASSCWASCSPTHLPGHSCQGCSQSILFHLNPFVLVLHWPIYRTLHLALLNFTRITQAHLRCLQAPLDGIPSFQSVNSTTQFCVFGKVAEGALDPTVHVTDKDAKCPNTNPWGTTLVTGLHLDIELFTAILQCKPPVNPYPPSDTFVKSMPPV